MNGIKLDKLLVGMMMLLMVMMMMVAINIIMVMIVSMRARILGIHPEYS